MDYLKVPELLDGTSLPFRNDGNELVFDHKISECDFALCISGEYAKFLASLINVVYTPTTGLLAQLEDQKRVIEELKQQVAMQSIAFVPMPAQPPQYLPVINTPDTKPYKIDITCGN